MNKECIEQRALYWNNLIANETPFYAEHIFHFLNFLYPLHEQDITKRDTKIEDTILRLNTPGEKYFQIRFFQTDPDDPDDPDEQFRICYRINSTLTKNLLNKLNNNSVLPPEINLEQYSIKSHHFTEKYSILRIMEPGIIHSQMAGTDFPAGKGKIPIEDTLEIAKTFGIGLAKNLLKASNYTLSQKNAYNFEN